MMVMSFVLLSSMLASVLLFSQNIKWSRLGRFRLDCSVYAQTQQRAQAERAQDFECKKNRARLLE